LQTLLSTTWTAAPEVADSRPQSLLVEPRTRFFEILEDIPEGTLAALEEALTGRLCERN